MDKKKKQIEYINEGVNYINNLLTGTHNYSKIIDFLPKLLSIDKTYNDKIIEAIKTQANSVNITSEGMKELENAPIAILTQKIKQNEAVIKWLTDFKEIYSPKKTSTPPIFTNDSWWKLIDEKIVELAYEKFYQKHFADAVLTCLRELNSILKKHAIKNGREERDGPSLINNTFSVANPLIELADLSTESGRNIQVGYMKMFEGMMIGIRNPKSHENLYPDEITSIHLIFFASFMMKKLRENGVEIKTEELKND